MESEIVLKTYDLLCHSIKLLTRKRDNSIDIARGIAILGVLYGHAMAWQDIHGTMLVHWFWSFHMALFALVPGYFYKKSHFGNPL